MDDYSIPQSFGQRPFGRLSPPIPSHVEEVILPEQSQQQAPPPQMAHTQTVSRKHYEHDEVDWLEMFLPTSIIPLMALLVLISPIAILAGESLLIPWFAEMLVSGAQKSLPAHFYVKIIGYFLFVFLGCFQLLCRIKTVYISNWASQFDRPHPLHIDYYPSTRLSLMAMLKWNGYWLLNVFVPPLAMTALTFAVSAFGLYLFNLSLGLPAISLSIQMIFGIFILLILGGVTFFAYLRSLWVSLTTMYGNIICITEPLLSVENILQRCGRIAFRSPYSMVLYPCLGLYTLAVIGGIVMLLINFDIQDFLSFKPEIILAYFVTTLLMIGYIALLYFRLFSYHHALSLYYLKLPRQIKEYFRPPNPVILQADGIPQFQPIRSNGDTQGEFRRFNPQS